MRLIIHDNLKCIMQAKGIEDAKGACIIFHVSEIMLLEGRMIGNVIGKTSMCLFVKSHLYLGKLIAFILR